MENVGCINSSVIAKKLCSENNDIVGRCYKSTTEAFHCTSNFHNSRNFTALFIYFHWKKNRLHKLNHYSFIHLLYSLMKLVFSFSREDAHYLSHILAFEPAEVDGIVLISYLVIKKNLILWYVSPDSRGKNMISL